MTLEDLRGLGKLSVKDNVKALEDLSRDDLLALARALGTEVDTAETLEEAGEIMDSTFNALLRLEQRRILRSYEGVAELPLSDKDLEFLSGEVREEFMEFHDDALKIISDRCTFYTVLG